MILTRDYLRRVVNQGSAREPGGFARHGGHLYTIVDRIDFQRVDHYLATQGDLDRHGESDLLLEQW